MKRMRALKLDSVKISEDKFHKASERACEACKNFAKARARQQPDAVMSLYFVDSCRGFALQCFSLTLGVHAQ